MRNKQTAAMTLFGLINNMSKLMQNAGDEQFANILKHIFDEYAGMTIAMEKKQIEEAYDNGGDHYTETGKAIWGKDYYKETYGK